MVITRHFRNSQDDIVVHPELVSVAQVHKLLFDELAEEGILAPARNKQVVQSLFNNLEDIQLMPTHGPTEITSLEALFETQNGELNLTDLVVRLLDRNRLNTLRSLEHQLPIVLVVIVLSRKNIHYVLRQFHYISPLP